MEVWLKGARLFQFPVNPASYTVTTERGDEIVDINALGEIDLGGKRKLKSVSFSGFFPYEYADYCTYASFPDPETCVEIIEDIMAGNPAKLTITGTPIKMYCRVSSFSWGEQDGSGDIYYDITLTEHRGVQAVRSSVTVDEAIAKRALPPVSTQAVEVVKQEGESLSAVARRTTGSTSNKGPIATYNKIKETVGSSAVAQTLVVKDGTVMSNTKARKSQKVTESIGTYARAKVGNAQTKKSGAEAFTGTGGLVLDTANSLPSAGTSTHTSSSGRTHGGGKGGRYF
jgi:hypothetical protein